MPQESAPNAPSRRLFWRGVASTLAGALLWGFSGACIQFLGTEYGVSSSFISLARSATSGLLFLAFLLIARREPLLALLGSAMARPVLLLFGVAIYLSQITYAVSVSLTNAGTATVLQATCAIFIMLHACLRSRHLPRLWDFIGLLCAMAATVLIATQGDWGVIVLPLAGLVWGIANALSEASYILAPQRLYGRFDRLSIIGCGMIVSCVAAAVVWLVGGLWESASAGSALDVAALVPAMDAAGWLALIGGVGFLGTFAAFGLFLYGVSLVGSVKGSLLGVAEPAGAMVIAALWLAQPFTAADWLGLALMTAMIALVSISGAKEEAGEV